MNNVSHLRHRSASSSPRGVAMLLVIVSLAMATILTTAYLASRDNSTAIGENITAAAAARWAAESALELAVGVLETDSEWRTMHTNGMLFEFAPLAGALTSVELVDLETRLPPTAKTEQVLIRATAISGSITKTATARALVRTQESQKTAQVDLSDFALFTVNSAVMANNALLAPWPTSPAADYAQRINIATRGTAMGTIDLRDDSRLLDVTVFSGPGTSATYLKTTKSQFVEEIQLPDHLPVPAPPSTGVSPPSGLLLLDLLLPLTNLLSNTNRYRNIDVSNSGTVLQLSSGSTLIADKNLRLRDNTGISAKGPAKIVVFGDMQLDPNSFIQVEPGASIDLFVFGTVTINNAYIGNAGADRASRPVNGKASWVNPHRVRIYTIPKVYSGDPVNTPTWTMVNQSVVKGNVYAPNANVVMRNTSALYGRLSASTVAMHEDTRVFYDQAMNRGTGFANPKSALYNPDKTFKSEFKNNLSTLDSSTLASIASSTGLLVKSADRSFGTLDADDKAPVNPGDPTPRTMDVEVLMSSIDLDVTSWEK